MFYYLVAFLIPFIAAKFESEPDLDSNEWAEVKPRSQKELVDEMIGIGYISSDRVENAMFKNDRKNFIDKDYYETEKVFDLGYGATCSTPQVHAVSLECIKIAVKEGSKVLEIGVGNGYLTSCLAVMAGETGYVVGVEHIPELVQKAKENIMKEHPEFLETRRIRLIEGDGRLGYPQDGPYDAITVGAIIKTKEVPEPLMQQLKCGGRLIIPLDQWLDEKMHLHEVMIVDKLLNGTVKTKLNGVYYETYYEFLLSKEEQLANYRNKTSNKNSTST